MKTETKKAFSKAQIKAAEQLLFSFEDTLEKLSDLGRSIGNNEYLMRSGISVNCDFTTSELKNIKTRIVLKIVAIVPPKNI